MHIFYFFKMLAEMLPAFGFGGIGFVKHVGITSFRCVRLGVSVVRFQPRRWPRIGQAIGERNLKKRISNIE
jgi:hypothetical protein